MAFTMERWYSATKERFAVRSYKGEPSQGELEALEELAKALSGRGVRIALGYDKHAFSPILMGMGRVKGTSVFAAFISRDADMRSLGYLGEAFVLECTALGFGTCWLGIYNKKRVKNAVSLLDGETLTCITPIGISKESYTPRPRKPLSLLTGLSDDVLRELPEWQKLALNCGRRAPSAVNAQPWKYTVEGERLSVTPTSSNYGYGLVDLGITMLHIELGAAHGGVAGEWSFENDDAVFTPMSYNN